MSYNLRKEIYDFLNLNETEELVDIWQKNDHYQWSRLAFDVVREILQERLGELPPQGEPAFEQMDDDPFNDETLPEKIVTISTNNGSWSWYKAWVSAFLCPNEKTWKKFSSEGNFSFIQANIWIFLTSFSYPLAAALAVWIKDPGPISVNYMMGIMNMQILYLPSVIEALIFFALLVRIAFHLASLFRGKGEFQTLFVIYAAILAAYNLLISIVYFWIWIYPSLFADLIFVTITFYCFLIVPAKAIKNVYQFHPMGAFLINLIAITLYFLVYLAWIVVILPIFKG